MASTSAPFSVKDFLSRDDIAYLTKRSDWLGVWMIFANWAIIIFAFTLAALWTNPLTILIAWVLLGNRQLGLGILTHECAHNSLFENRALNRFCGHWLCGAPSFVDLEGYRRYHLSHHRQAGTASDPDYPNYSIYPIKRDSFKRKIIRDLLGITGVKNFMGIMLMQMGVFDYDLSYKPKERHQLPLLVKLRNLLRNAYRPLLFQIGFFCVLYLLGLGWLFLLWWVSFLTISNVFARLRNAAEHASVPDLLDLDPRKNTRTTLVSWWERLTVAPNYVNYHLEHHMMASVPSYRLPLMHRLLKERGALEDAEVVRGYPEVIRRMVAV